MEKGITKTREKGKKNVKENRGGRDRDFAKLTKPEITKGVKIVKKNPIYHNQGKQYLVKIPKEIMKYMEYKKGDQIRYTLIISPTKTKNELKIEYVKK
ncbi:MAG: hypothetical protein ABIH65_01660 [Nanoarchaeota archaeon]